MDLLTEDQLMEQLIMQGHLERSVPNNLIYLAFIDKVKNGSVYGVRRPRSSSIFLHSCRSCPDVECLDRINSGGDIAYKTVLPPLAQSMMFLCTGAVVSELFIGSVIYFSFLLSLYLNIFSI